MRRPIASDDRGVCHAETTEPIDILFEVDTRTNTVHRAPNPHRQGFDATFAKLLWLTLITAQTQAGQTIAQRTSGLQNSLSCHSSLTETHTHVDTNKTSRRGNVSNSLGSAQLRMLQT